MLLAGGDRGKRRRGQVVHDPEVLQGRLHQELQKDDRRRLLGEADANHVRGRQAHVMGEFAKKFAHFFQALLILCCNSGHGWTRGI